MPNLNVVVSEELLKAIRVKCAEDGVAQKDWVPEVLGKAAGVRDGSGRAGKRSGKALRVRVEPDGAQGGIVPSVGEVNDEQLRGGVSEGRVQGSNEPKRVEESKAGKSLDCQRCKNSQLECRACGGTKGDGRG